MVIQLFSRKIPDKMPWNDRKQALTTVFAHQMQKNRHKRQQNYFAVKTRRFIEYFLLNTEIKCRIIKGYIHLNQ